MKRLVVLGDTEMVKCYICDTCKHFNRKMGEVRYCKKDILKLSSDNSRCDNYEPVSKTENKPKCVVEVMNKEGKFERLGNEAVKDKPLLDESNIEFGAYVESCKVIEVNKIISVLRKFKDAELVFHLKDNLGSEPIKVKCLTCGSESYFAYIYKEKEYCPDCWFAECIGVLPDEKESEKVK